jgi:hypothetical protein
MKPSTVLVDLAITRTISAVTTAVSSIVVVVVTGAGIVSTSVSIGSRSGGGGPVFSATHGRAISAKQTHIQNLPY